MVKKKYLQLILLLAFVPPFAAVSHLNILMIRVLLDLKLVACLLISYGKKLILRSFCDIT